MTGGKSLSGRQRQLQALQRQETVSQHDQSQMLVQAVLAPPLEVVQAAFLFGIFVQLLDHEAAHEPG